MAAAIIGSLLFTGLCCFWVSLQGLVRLDWEQARARIPEPDKEQPEGEAEPEKPALTRLGRPIEEIRLQA